MKKLNIKKSALIYAAYYDVNTRTAIVKFQSGALYLYNDMSPRRITQWLKSKSIGKYFLKNIRNYYDYCKLPDKF